MELIAISENEETRLIKQGRLYILQDRWVPNWKNMKQTETEWLASKWILDLSLTVSSDYPTIEEIRSRQSEEQAK